MNKQIAVNNTLLSRIHDLENIIELQNQLMLAKSRGDSFDVELRHTVLQNAIDEYYHTYQIILAIEL